MKDNAAEQEMENDEYISRFEALLCENRLLRARERTAHYSFVSLAQATLLTEALLAATSRQEAFVAIELLFGSLLSGRGVTVFEVDGDIARPDATHGEGAVWRPLSSTRGLYRRSLEEGAAVFDSKAEERAGHERKSADPQPTLIIPLRVGPEVLGVVAATVSNVSLPPPPLDVLDVFGRRAAEALERVSTLAPSRRVTLRLV
jgi:hypothetical protein